MTDEDLIHADASPDLSQSGQQSSVPTARTMGHLLYDVIYPDPYPTAEGAHPMPFLLHDVHWQQRYEAAADAVIEECAKIADAWGRGEWRVEEKTRSRFTVHDLQVRVNTTGRAIAEDIRSLKSNPKGEEHDGS